MNIKNQLEATIENIGKLATVVQDLNNDKIIQTLSDLEKLVNSNSQSITPPPLPVMPYSQVKDYIQSAKTPKLLKFLMDSNNIINPYISGYKARITCEKQLKFHRNKATTCLLLAKDILHYANNHDGGILNKIRDPTIISSTLETTMGRALISLVFHTLKFALRIYYVDKNLNLESVTPKNIVYTIRNLAPTDEVNLFNSLPRDDRKDLHNSLLTAFNLCQNQVEFDMQANTHALMVLQTYQQLHPISTVLDMLTNIDNKGTHLKDLLLLHHQKEEAKTNQKAEAKTKDPIDTRTSQGKDVVVQPKDPIDTRTSQGKDVAVQPKDPINTGTSKGKDAAVQPKDPIDTGTSQGKDAVAHTKNPTDTKTSQEKIADAQTQVQPKATKISNLVRKLETDLVDNSSTSSHSKDRSAKKVRINRNPRR